MNLSLFPALDRHTEFEKNPSWFRQNNFASLCSDALLVELLPEMALTHTILCARMVRNAAKHELI